MLYYSDILYILKIIRTKLINCHYNYLLVGYFEIKNLNKLITRKYHYLILYYNIQCYISSFHIYLVFKVVKYTFYGSFQSVPVLIYQ